jgi:hypothetical protein
MAYVSWEDFMKGRAPQSVYCFGVQWPEWPIMSLLIKKGAKPPTPYQKLKAWLVDTCHGDWSVTSIPARKGCVVAFENSNDYAEAVGFLRPNGPWRLSELPACAAARKTKIGVELYQRLPPVAARHKQGVGLTAPAA